MEPMPAPRYAKEPCCVIASCCFQILQVLSLRHIAQIRYTIIRSVTIDVVDIVFRKSAVNV